MCRGIQEKIGGLVGNEAIDASSLFSWNMSGIRHGVYPCSLIYLNEQTSFDFVWLQMFSNARVLEILC